MALWGASAASCLRLLAPCDVEASTGPRLAGAKEAAEVIRGVIPEDGREHVVALLLDSRRTLLGHHTVSIGSVASSIVHPRELFRAAILANASAVVVGHCHPSGDPSPSVEDHSITTRLREAGAVIGIELLDHIVVGSDERYSSFRDEGWIT